jgi:beta-glucosidase
MVAASARTPYLSLNGTKILDNPGTPPVSTYTLAVSGDSSQLLWGTPSALAPGITAAVKAAKTARTAVVVVSDDTESEATDRPSLNLPSAQNELIEAVAAANPHTVVVINAGAPVAMPWLNQVASVLDAWYPGQGSGTALASVLFGRTDPGGHLPVTFPTSLSEVPASTTAQFPGNGTDVLYSEGVDVGYRWYDANDLTPLYPFGFGLSYTKFAQDVRVSATVTNTGSRTGSDVAQLYIGDPASTGEPPRQLEGFQRVNLKPGQSARVSFVITPQDTSWWSDTANGWTQTAGLYHVYVGDSSAPANLPLRNTFQLTSTPGARRVAIAAPSVMHAGQASVVRVTLSAGGSQTLHGVQLALQLPAGWTVTPAKVVSGTVRPGDTVVATFRVTPPSYSPDVRRVLSRPGRHGPGRRRGPG